MWVASNSLGTLPEPICKNTSRQADIWMLAEAKKEAQMPLGTWTSPARTATATATATAAAVPAATRPATWTSLQAEGMAVEPGLVDLDPAVTKRFRTVLAQICTYVRQTNQVSYSIMSSVFGVQ